MQRRAMIAGLGAAFAATKIQAADDPTPIRPRALRPGDTVGLITPSTSVTDPDQIQTVARTIEYFGLKAKWGANVRKQAAYLGGTVAERVDDLHAMFTDPEVRAVFAIRGGYGSAQLLDRIDYDLIRRNPKIFIGYSDITALHLAIHKIARLVTFHGPVPMSQFTAYTQGWYRKALFGTEPLGALSNPPELNPLRPEHHMRTIRGGQARGRLVGGNLTLISTTMGTPWEIDTRGSILFTEDIDEEPYRIDRMLTQLRLAGKLDEAAGIVIGECVDCRPKDYKPSFNSTYTLGEVLDNILGGLKIPVLFGLTLGHTEDQVTLPEGVMASLDADKGVLTIEEPAVSG